MKSVRRKRKMANIKQTVVRTTQNEFADLVNYLGRGWRVVMCNQVTVGVLEYVLQKEEEPISLEKR
jgi:hypothetical protein